MNLRANTETKFLLKYLFIGAACLAFAAWAFYDGFFNYPSQIPRAQAWEDLQAEIASSEILTPEDLSPRWKQISEENGWSSKRLTDAHPVEALEKNIIYQYAFIAIGLLVGIPCVLWYLRTKGSWLESTEDGLRLSSGQELKLSQITKFDKNKWEKKGIGVLHYSDEKGQENQFVIDDLKYQRKTTDQIVAWIETQIPPEMIVNGLTEVEYKAKADEKKRLRDIASGNIEADEGA